MSRNVQKYSKEVYLRASEAAQCRVHSTVVLPLFTAPDRRRSLGVVEVVQTQQDMSFPESVATLARSLALRARPPDQAPPRTTGAAARTGLSVINKSWNIGEAVMPSWVDACLS